MKEFIINYIQNYLMDKFCKKYVLSEQLALIINVLSNIDKMSMIQFTISQAGVYKYLLWCIYVLFIV
jgi:hypothetical protein